MQGQRFSDPLLHWTLPEVQLLIFARPASSPVSVLPATPEPASTRGLQPRLGFPASAATHATMRTALCCALLAVLLACTGIDAGRRG